MKLSELKYITQEHIDETYVNVTSSEMYDEVQRFNEEMFRMHRERAVFLRDFWVMILMNFVLVWAGIFSMSMKRSLLYSFSGGNLMPGLLAAMMFAAAFGYFILYRRNYCWKTGVLLTGLMLIPMNYLMIAAAAANGIVLRLMERIDVRLRDQAGYPHFFQLVTSYIREEDKSSPDKTDEPEQPFSFEKYKNNDLKMLADTDIGEKSE